MIETIFFRRSLLRLAVLLLVLSSLTACTTAEKANFYVAPNGNDSSSGTEAKPFATLDRARDAVQELKSRTQEPITVWVRAGTYYLSEPVVFEAEDSGAEAQPITYAAYPGEKVTLSGGMRIEGQWETYRDGIMKTPVPDGITFTQLFINGKRRMRARFPDFDPEKPLMGEGGYLNATGGGEREFYYDPATFTRKRWSKPAEVIVHIFPGHYWHNAQYRVRSIDRRRLAVKLGEGGWQTNEFLAPNEFQENSRFFFDNVFEELDAPNEWYLDIEKNLLYFKPPEGLDLTSAKVEVDQLRQLIEVRGSKDHPVHHLKFSGFRFAHTAATFMDPYELPSTGDWGIYRGGTVLMEGAEDCAIENSFFDAVGGNALFINGHNRRIRVYGNTFSNTGDSAVCLVGRNNMDESKTWTCPLCGAKRPWDFAEVDEYPAECLISNNRMHDIGVYGKQTAGVFITMSRKNTISHNHIYDMPRSAICINDPYWGGHIVEYNDIHDTVRETDDHGPFNSWGRGHYWCLAQNAIKVSHAAAGDVKKDAQFTTLIRYNRFRDRTNYGITMDDGSANYHVYNNLCLGTGLQNREGEYRLVENNIFINPTHAIGYDVGYENNHDQFVRNIVVVNASFLQGSGQEGAAQSEDPRGYATRSDFTGHMYRVVYPPTRGKWIGEIDSNLLFNFQGPFSATITLRGDQKEIYSQEKWQRLGFDQNSVFTDPMFVDPANGDFRVRPESPALKLGFKNFDMDNFGLLPDFPQQWRE